MKTYKVTINDTEKSYDSEETYFVEAIHVGEALSKAIECSNKSSKTLYNFAKVRETEGELVN